MREMLAGAEVTANHLLSQACTKCLTLHLTFLQIPPFYAQIWYFSMVKLVGLQLRIISIIN